LIDDPHVQIVIHQYLAGQPRMVAEVLFRRKNVAFGVADLTRIARDHLYAAGCATGISAATMKNVDAAILDLQNESAARLDI
jgi:hypothetical protein